MKKLGALLLAGAVAGAAVLAGCGAPPADNTAAGGSYTTVWNKTDRIL